MENGHAGMAMDGFWGKDENLPPGREPGGIRKHFLPEKKVTPFLIVSHTVLSIYQGTTVVDPFLLRLPDGSHSTSPCVRISFTNWNVHKILCDIKGAKYRFKLQDGT